MIFPFLFNHDYFLILWVLEQRTNRLRFTVITSGYIAWFGLDNTHRE